jgi:hypothetical protein
LGKNSFGRFKYIIVAADDVMVYAGVKQCGYVLVRNDLGGQTMTREKQIREMARDLCCAKICPKEIRAECIGLGDCDQSKYVAVHLYNEGYRMQSEGEWKQTTEPLGCHDVDCVECSACGESWVLDEDFDYDVVKDFWNYCPACGAKMKGGAEE